MTAINQQPEAEPGRTAGEPEAQPDLRCHVTLTREHQADAQQRQVLVRLDEGPTSALLFGDRITVEVDPGDHSLRVNNTLFWKRVPFTIEPGQHLEFTLINKAGRLTIGFLAVMGVAPLYLEIERRRVR